MNILISSTQQWNPGDEFIRMGVVKLIEDALGTGHNYILWNRNPDLFVQPWSNTQQKSKTFSNCAREIPTDIIHLVVFAGTPEWLGDPVKPIYEALAKSKIEIPLWAIGVGLSHNLENLSSAERTVLNRKTTKIITRSFELRDQLNTLLGESKAITLPCPALFSSDVETTKKTKNTAFILQDSAVVNQSISEELVQQFLQHKNFDVICFYQEEFNRFTRLGLNTIYQFDSKAYFPILAQYKKVISTRLHGAIASLSTLSNAILVCDDSNYRIKTAAKPYGDMLPIMTIEEALKFNRNFDIKEYKKQIFEMYRQALENTWLL